MSPEEILVVMTEIRRLADSIPRGSAEERRVRNQAIVKARDAGWGLESIGHALRLQRERVRMLERHTRGEVVPRNDDLD